MSPEFNFHIKIDLPSVEIAKTVAHEIEKKVGVEVVILDSDQAPIRELESKVKLGRPPITGIEKEAMTDLPFGQIFRYLRQREGLSQREISRTTGIDPSSISRLEDGKSRNPRLSTVFKLLNSLGIQPMDSRFRILVDKLPHSERDAVLSLLQRIESSNIVT